MIHVSKWHRADKNSAAQQLTRRLQTRSARVDRRCSSLQRISITSADRRAHSIAKCVAIDRIVLTAPALAMPVLHARGTHLSINLDAEHVTRGDLDRRPSGAADCPPPRLRHVQDALDHFSLLIERNT